MRDAIYFAMVDRFSDGRPDPEGTVDRTDPQAWHGGDLRGLIDHLDHLEDLGVGALWLTPITRARTEKIDEWGAFHGYWVEDLGAVEPRLGTLDDARELAAALDARGMGLWLDMVYNHVGYDAPLTMEHPEWFHGKGDVRDWSDPVQVVTHDVHGLPDLRQEDEAVYAHLLEGSRLWVRELRPTGFRVDAVRHLPEGFLARLRDDLRADDPDFELLGEVFEGHAAALAARQRTDRLDRVFDFPLHYAMKDVFCGDAHTGRIASVFGQDGAYSDPSALVTFLDNHDVSRVRAACGEDRGRVARALAFLVASRGTPSLTWGTEIGLSGAEEPENRADMAFDGREPDTHALVKQLLGIRATWPALRDGTTVVERADADVLVLRRVLPTEQAWVVLNASDAPVDAPPGDGWVVTGAVGPLTGPVPPGAVALVRERGAFAAPSTAAVPVRLEAEAPLAEGDTLLVVGTGPSLGDWSPDRAPAVTDGALEMSLTNGTVIAFKLVIRAADGTVRWEDRADRYLHVRGETSARLAWNMD